ncbi:beta-glucanase [Vibrio neptunius]|uniref:glycoside hydrolase family 16 protein n=1 Tax=Vibrio neptunius TaxID=170651 RepID=UPI0005FA4831|nr:glycoside hydrolase family 16 protein [Vibrio neptunius]KJY86934.1 beta-glucanase [Vibrio neptunius]
MFKTTHAKSLLFSLASAVVLSSCSSAATARVPISSQHGAQITPSSDWQLVWEEQFEGKAISKRNWSFEENCWGGGNNELQCYTARSDNAFVSDGYLHIVAKEETYTGSADPQGNLDGPYQTMPYTSARLRTLGKRDFKYGRVEVRAKLPAGQGTWPAIWMLPSENKYGAWAASGEIDIVEAVNLKAQSDSPNAKEGELERRVHGTLHYGSEWPNNVSSGAAFILPDGLNPADDFHTYAIEWEEGEIRWYVDDIHYATQTHHGWYSQYVQDGKRVDAHSFAPFNEKFHLILNLAIGGSWAGQTNETGVDETIFPVTMLVDFVKVYRCSVDRWKGKGCSVSAEEAILVEGHQAPGIIAQDTTYADGSELDVFVDELHPSLAYDSYDPNNVIEHQLTKEAGRGQVLSIIKSGDVGNLYFRSPETNITHWLETGVLTFDIQVDFIEAGTELLVKVDSGWPLTSDITVKLEQSNQWQTVDIVLSELVARGNRYQAGSAVDPTRVNNLLVFEPTGPMSFKIDNIRWHKR